MSRGEASMQKFHHLRALALLGALILYLFLWPICCCAAKPTWSPLLLTRNVEHANMKTSNSTNSNQTYQDLMTGLMGDKISAKVDFLNTPSGNISKVMKSDKGTVVHNVEANKNVYKIIDSRQESLLSSETESYSMRSESTTTSIYELFNVSRNNERKLVSSNQILSRTDRSVHLNSSNSRNNSVSGAKRVKNNKTKLSPLERNERSANLSHITGSARKIQLYIKNRFLQLLPDGTVNGTTDDLSDYTILQRTTVNVGQIKIQGVATCLFLCMNSCGTTYGSAEFTDDCIFNESMEQHHYNTYSSTFHSNSKRKLYLGLNRHGQPRKILIPATRQLGKLSTYTKSLTQTVAHERVEQLIARLYGANHVRHGLKQLCDTGKVLPEIISKGLKSNPKCNNLAKPNKKKKKKRKCREDEPEGDHCVKATSYSINSQQQFTTKNNNSITNINNKKKVSNGNQNQKKCAANDDCNSQKPNKKKPTKKNQPSKSTPASNNGIKSKIKKKPTKTVTIVTTTPKPDEIDHDQIGKDEAFTSDELEDEEDYDEMNVSSAGHTINLIDDHEHDDYNN